MLTSKIIEQILEGIARLRLAVVGDLFLDRYLDIDHALTEPSIETGLDAYQITRVRSYPGAAGTVINNLVALGVGAVWPIAMIGDDGEGYELRQALSRLSGLDARYVLTCTERRTPTYTKPMLHEAGRPPRELNRLDIQNRTPLPGEPEQFILHALEEVWPLADAIVVLDQVNHADCGVVTARVRQRLAELGQRDSQRVVLADSRQRAGLFRGVCLKPNEAECLRSTPGPIETAIMEMARRTGRPVFCTRGERGILVADPRSKLQQPTAVPAYPVTGPVDIVGAGDSTSAGIVCALAAGAGTVEAAAFGNLVASITIQQLGVTGTATPAQVRHAWRTYADMRLVPG